MTPVRPAASTPLAAQPAWTVADALLAKRGHSFHLARRLLSARHAERATRLYGWCRLMDDLADEGPSKMAAHAAFAAVRVALNTGQCSDPATRDMLMLMHECGIPAAIPLDLIQGIESDLGTVRVADLNELLGYAYRVAGTVGLMMTAALDVATPEALPHAIDLGIAMQLTNICRDVRDDALLGRRYLPASLVGAVEPAALIEPVGEVRANAMHAMRTLLDVADRHYASGEQGLRYLPAGARAGILVAARVYREIGVVLRRREFDCWSARARVGTAAKAAIALSAFSGTAAPRRRPAEALTHGQTLHRQQRAGPTWAMGADLGR
ncbi:MAG: phytoene/squalene synthase family protein [Rubrivivax sp.]|nr:phytoene/squalene synthase family protein [Rubrivivax sp.]